MSVVGFVWAKLHEPRLVTFWTIVNYTLVGLIGAALLVMPPITPDTYFGHVVLASTSLMLLLACGVGAFACYKGVWWVERVAILITVLGLAAQVPLLWNLFPTLEWRMLLCLSVGDSVAAMLRRHALISWAYLDPTR